MTSAMLGLYQRDRKTPVRSSTTKLHSAISPSMKDQWSGKTLRTCFFADPAMPARSSTQLAAPPNLERLGGVAAVLALVLMSASFPEARAHRFPEVTGGDEVALLVDGQRQLRQCAGGRTEDHLAVVGEVEGG